ncbi:MAG TPA: class A beta-lactamase-related serine hydrolase [Chitinophagaceae bacterium]|nr:serine hydrolase [Chitinophagaceae bacterium]MCB9055078.1 serine hydrolase [Chitinophagales bacterium]HPG09944.1 class A beta-lactamase-related serine hydrolase [Chitinophagaceae bacterium]
MQRLIFVLLFLIPMATIAQKTDKKLGLKIQEAIAGYNGDIGVYVKNLRTGRTIAINADTIFPTASIVKVQILAGITDKIEKGELQYNQEFVYKDSLLYEGSDILGSFKQDETITLKKLIMLMLTTSDNTASLWLQSIAGTGARINEIMESLGLHYTRVNSRVPGREEYRAIYQWGQTTPHEMATLFEMIYRKKVISPEASEKMMRQLSRNFWDDVALSQIPPTVEVFSKNGAVNASRSEVLLVNHHKNPYILSVFTKNNKDQSWETDNEAWVLTRKISKMVWDFYGDK